MGVSFFRDTYPLAFGSFELSFQNLWAFSHIFWAFSRIFTLISVFVSSRVLDEVLNENI